MVILLLAFGSVIAMGLPIGTALFGLGAGIALITFLSAFIDIPSHRRALATMIGLGVGIDYALFIITRHRAGLHRGLTVEDAAGRAIATAGQAVVIAGGTVVIAICGLAVAGIPLVTFMGVGAAIVVAVMVVAAVTLAARAHRLRRAQHRSLRHPGHAQGQRRPTRDDDGNYHGWARWAHHVSRHPVMYLVGGARRRPRCSPRRCFEHAARVRPTRARTRRARRCAAATTCSPRASAPASTGR